MFQQRIALNIALLLGGLVFTASVHATNPLTTPSDAPLGTPQLDRIHAADFQPAIEQQILRYTACIDTIRAVKPEQVSFDNIIVPLYTASRELNHTRSLLHLFKTCLGGDSLVQASLKITPRIIAAIDDQRFDARLFERIKLLYDKREQLGLDSLQARILGRYYRQYERQARLTPQQQAQLTQLDKALAEKSTRYGQNTLQAGYKQVIFIQDAAALSGLSKSFVEQFAHRARALGHPGEWAIDVTDNAYGLILARCANRDLRERLHKAYLTRCSTPGAYDNRQLAVDILNLRLEKAQLFGYTNYAEYALKGNTAGTPQAVYDMLVPLTRAVLEKRRFELKEIEDFAARTEGVGFRVEPWDISYYSGKLRSEKFGRHLNNTPQYFPLDSVIAGLFYVSNRLFGITATERRDIPVYAPDVRAFELREADDTPLGVVYLDLFSRKGKRKGAWSVSLRRRSETPQGVQLPLAAISSNISRAGAGKPQLLGQRQVTMLFHEFGHVLATLFPDGPFADITGGAPRDMSELPSQLMEHWAWEPVVLKSYARHYQTGNPIPYSLIDKIGESELFLKSNTLSTACGQSLLDLELHSITRPITVEQLSALGKSVQERYGIPDYIHNAPTCFNHIFDGPYASLYYTYLWSSVLDTDAYAAFTQTGDCFDPQTAGRLRKYVLSQVSAGSPIGQYVRFRGSRPDPAILYERYQLPAPQQP